jgi:hypothetical protein
MMTCRRLMMVSDTTTAAAVWPPFAGATPNACTRGSRTAASAGSATTPSPTLEIVMPTWQPERYISRRSVISQARPRPRPWNSSSENWRTRVSANSVVTKKPLDSRRTTPPTSLAAVASSTIGSGVPRAG